MNLIHLLLALKGRVIADIEPNPQADEGFIIVLDNGAKVEVGWSWIEGGASYRFKEEFFDIHCPKGIE